MAYHRIVPELFEQEFQEHQKTRNSREERETEVPQVLAKPREMVPLHPAVEEQPVSKGKFTMVLWHIRLRQWSV